MYFRRLASSCVRQEYRTLSRVSWFGDMLQLLF